MTTRQMVLLWLACALLFGALLAWAEISRNPKDNPDPARQRGVYLHTPRPAPSVIPGFPRQGKRLAVIFVFVPRANRCCSMTSRCNQTSPVWAIS